MIGVYEMIDRSFGDSLIDIALSNGAIFAEIFYEDTLRNDISICNGKIIHLNKVNYYGIGIRVFDGISTIYASTNERNKEKLKTLVRDMTIAISDDKLNNVFFKYSENIIVDNEIDDIKLEEVLGLLKDSSLKINDKVIKVNYNYIDSFQKATIINSLGTYAENVRSTAVLKTHLALNLVDENNVFSHTKIANSKSNVISLVNDEMYIENCIKKSMKSTEKVPCPSGKIPVILGNGSGGIIFHEACGHNLEASRIVNNSSVFCNKIGERVASESVTLIDDGTLKDCCGTISVDDEGEKTRKNILIENGILRSFLIDRINGYKLNMKPTGSARRQSYRFSPTARMTNTYLFPGDMDEKEIISNTKFAILVNGVSGGSVNPSNGDFSFGVSDGNIVRNGKVGASITNAIIRGNSASVLNNIDAIGKNTKFEQGMCVAESGLISTSVGQPMVRINGLEVGGV